MVGDWVILYYNVFGIWYVLILFDLVFKKIGCLGLNWWSVINILFLKVFWFGWEIFGRFLKMELWCCVSFFRLIVWCFIFDRVLRILVLVVFVWLFMSIKECKGGSVLSFVVIVFCYVLYLFVIVEIFYLIVDKIVVMVFDCILLC